MMQQKPLYIKGTSKTPEINFSSGVLEISGRSIPEDSVTFYEPILKWTNTYLKSPQKLTRISLHLEYINSGSNRFIYQLLKQFADAHEAGNNVVIHWYFDEDDDTIKTLGEDFKAMFKDIFNLKANK